MYQSCRRPADHGDVESSVAEDDSDESDGSEGATGLGDLMVLDPEAAPNPPAAAPGILLFSLTSVYSRSNLLDSLLIQFLILSVKFSGQNYHGGVVYRTLNRLGSPLVEREPRYWWSAN